jgi:hypothetical protein
MDEGDDRASRDRLGTRNARPRDRATKQVMKSLRRMGSSTPLVEIAD